MFLFNNVNKPAVYFREISVSTFLAGPELSQETKTELEIQTILKIGLLLLHSNNNNNAAQQCEDGMTVALQIP